MKENLKFVTRVMVIHVVTYILCGVVFMSLFNYAEMYQQEHVKTFMRAVGSASSLIGPVMQVVRGLLFGFILLLLKNSIIEKKHGWLMLWAIIVVIGIINTPGPAPCSIEGIIYTQLPLEFHIKGAPEILVQTLLFSYFVTNPIKLTFPWLTKYKIPLLSAVLGGIMFSLSGVITALILRLDITAAMTDTGAYVVMFTAIIAVFLSSKWYLSAASRLKHAVLPLCCYAVLDVMPTVYNYATNSIFASRLTLGINVIPVVIIFLVNYAAAQHNKNIK